MSLNQHGFKRGARFAIEDITCGLRVLEVIAEPGALLADVSYRLQGVTCGHEFLLSHRSLTARQRNNRSHNTGYCPQCLKARSATGRFKGVGTNPELPAKLPKTNPSTASWPPTSGKLEWQ